MDYKKLLEPYCQKKLSSKEIAKLTELKPKYIQKLIKKYNLPRLKQGGQKGSKNGAWKGGQTTDKYGYLLIKADKHPHKNSLGYVRFHRLVMEKYLGRYLLKTEVVHHIDSNKKNNQINNLELFDNNGKHLHKELKGKIPCWSLAGKKKLMKNSFPFWKFSPTYLKKKSDGF